jgi:hypothetical protein
VTVTITSTALMGTRTTVTDTEGSTFGVFTAVAAAT